MRILVKKRILAGKRGNRCPECVYQRGVRRGYVTDPSCRGGGVGGLSRLTVRLPSTYLLPLGALIFIAIPEVVKII